MSADPAATALARLREGTEVLRTGGGAKLTASECNALLTEIEWLRDVAHAADCLIKSEDVRLGDVDQIRLSNLLCGRRPE